MDGQKIWDQRQRTEDWLSGAYYWQQHFVKTSEHPSWQGKVKCRYCKRNGWPQYDDHSGNRNPLWWGHKHGAKCRWKELYDLKFRNTLTNVASAGTLYVSTGSQWVSVGTTTTASTLTFNPSP